VEKEIIEENFGKKMRCEREIVGENFEKRKKKKQVRETIKKHGKK
jgi:hypothetical protein